VGCESLELDRLAFAFFIRFADGGYISSADAKESDCSTKSDHNFVEVTVSDIKHIEFAETNFVGV
jgi:hypothetical protein